MKVAIITTDVREYLRDYTIPLPSFGTAPTALLDGLRCQPDVEIHVISCARQPMRKQERLADNIWFHSVHVPRIGWMRTAYLGCIRATRRKIWELRPDIVHGQGTEQDCALDAVFSGFPNVLTIHGNMRLIAKLERARPFSFGWLAAHLETLSVPRSNGVVCITNYTLAAMRPLARQCWLVPNAVDPSLFKLERRVSPNAPACILCVGVISSRKNQNEFIRALDALATKYQLEVVFLGICSSEQAYVSEFKELVASRPWCSYPGFAGRQQLHLYLEKASMLVLPTIEDNCPMVVLEAMASGVPVIASAVGGVPDLIQNQETGLMCNPQDRASISRAVQSLLDTPELSATLAANAKVSAEKRFHPSIVANRHLEIYEEILKTPQRPTRN